MRPRGLGDDGGAPQHVDILISGGWVITVDPDRRIFRHGAVAVSGDKIVEVGQAADLEARYAATTTVDASRMVVTPGLVNGHRHLLATPKGAQPDGNVTLVNLRDFVYPAFAALTEDDMHAYALHACAEMMRFGTTLFEEPGCNHLQAVLDALATAGIRCRVGPWTWDHGGPAGANCPPWLKLSTDAAVERLENGVASVRAMNNSRIREAVTIEGVGTCSDELNVAAAEMAKALDSLMVIHKATSLQEVELELEVFGHRPVQHMYEIGAMNDCVLFAHMTALELFEVDLIAETGARISQNPSAALKLTKGTTQTGKWPELVAAGVPLALGTDAENASNHQDICRSMYLAALLPRDARIDPKAITAEQALEMATIGGAKALKCGDVTGSLEAGKQADITLFSTEDFDWRPLHNPVSNLVYGATGYSVDTVIIGGDIVVRNKELTKLDVAALRADVEKRDRRILREIDVVPQPAWPVL